MILLKYNSKHKINKKSRLHERYRASLFRFFKMKSVLYLTFFCTFAPDFWDFVINSARNSSLDLFPNPRGL